MGNHVSQGLLLSLGWYMPADYDIDRFARSKRLIIVISHTSHWDLFLLLLYRQAQPRIKNQLYIVIKPQPFERWGWFLNSVGAIPATRAEDATQGFVRQTVRRFKDQPLRLIISPEGKLQANSWRSGYYYLCQGLEADIAVAGVDYEKKTFYLGPVHPWDQVKYLSRTQLEESLQQEMGQIVPLYPENCLTPIRRPYDPGKVSAGQPLLLILIIVAIILIIIIIIVIVCGLSNKNKR